MKILPRRLHRLIIAALAIALLTACSAMRLAYNNAPELVHVYLDSRFDLTDAQSDVVKAELRSLQAWHRSKELPEIQRLLQKSQQLVQKNQSAQTICAVIDEVRPRFDAITTRAIPALTQVALSATPEQLASWKKSFDKRNAKWRADYIEAKPETRTAKRLESARENFERVYGSLTEDQLAALKRDIARNAWDAAASQKEALRRQADGLQTVQQISTAKPAPELARTQVAALLERNSTAADPAYRANMERWRSESCESWAAFHNSTTPAQRANAVAVLKGYEGDVAALIR